MKTRRPGSASSAGHATSADLPDRRKCWRRGLDRGRQGHRPESPSFGFDAQTGEYGDLIGKGIIDPAKVVRVALQDASSVAGLLVTTEAMVAERPKKDSGSPAMPGGGMGGMGGMDY